MASFQQVLQEARLRQGISLEEVAQRTYIKLPYLVALEEGQLDKLPAPVYIHGYIRQYARLLGVDGNELVKMYQEESNRYEENDEVDFRPENEFAAKGQAQQIIAMAQHEAQDMRISAERYADQVLSQLENEVSRSLQIVRNGRLFLQSKRRRAE